MNTNRFWVLLFLSFSLGHTSPVLAQTGINACGPLAASYGPFDFRTDREKLPLVVGAHFTPEVEALIRGTTNRLPGGDVAYTLRAIPNHPNALMAMMRLGEREKTPKPSGSTYTVECWFERAIRFRPDDHVVRMIYTIFLTKNNRRPEALQQLDVALNAAKDNPFTHQNIGLLYFDLGEYQRALTQAHKAIQLGLTRPELREKLQAVGKWTEPVAASAEPTLAEPSAAASTLTKP
jgi:hypothetical protein